MILASLVASPTPRKRLGRDTREEILNCAQELMQRRGYNAFSYQHIAVQLGIRNAAIHYHFPAKEDLGVALVRRYRQKFRDWAEASAHLPTAWLRMSAYFQTYHEYVADQCKICPGGMLGTEFEGLSQPMQQEARLLMREIYEWLIETLDAGRSDGSMEFIGDTRHKAVEIGAALQGSLQLARIAGPERFQQVLAQLGLELTAHQGDSLP